MLKSKMIGNKITEARKKVNISQAQLAQRLFISPQAVGKWERGESMPDIITFIRLAEILGVDLNYFSESLQSSATESASGESFNKQEAESPSGSRTCRPLLPDRQVARPGKSLAGICHAGIGWTLTFPG